MELCTVCGGSYYAKGFCRLHYYQQPHLKLARDASYQKNKEAKKAASKARYYAKKDECRKSAKEWATKNPEKMAEFKRKWHEENREKANEMARTRYYADHERSKELARKASSGYRKRNPGKDKEWRKANPDKSRAAASNRRARIKGAGGVHTAAEVILLMERQRGCCAVCKKKLPAAYHKDHVIPLARGGSNDILNIQLLCAPCNQSKNARDPVEYMQQRGYLL